MNDIIDTQVNTVMLTDMIERCLDMLDTNLDRLVGDMSAREVLEFIKILQDIREREARHMCAAMHNGDV